MRLAADLERLTNGIRALRTVRALIREGANVGKLSAIAERIRDTKTRLESEADKLGAKLDMIDQAAPVAFQRGHAFIAAQHAEVNEIESTLRQLSNLPLDDAPTSPGGSPVAPATTPPVAETAQAAITVGLDAHRSFPAATVSRAFGE